MVFLSLESETTIMSDLRYCFRKISRKITIKGTLIIYHHIKQKDILKYLNRTFKTWALLLETVV